MKSIKTLGSFLFLGFGLVFGFLSHGVLADSLKAKTSTTVPIVQSPAPSFPFQQSNLSSDARAADLVSRMTLDEKVSQMMNDAAAIPRLGIPAYEWWNEALHGVARAGAATVFPQAIGLAASFDREMMKEVSNVISDEARAKHQQFLRQDLHKRYQGLTFWSPNVNIFRDPRWGRGQETYGEDPYLTSVMGVTFVKGLQGGWGTADAEPGTPYRKLDATAKHFAVHSGPEVSRHQFDVSPSERDLYETYLPAFKALVTEGQVQSVMGAYNRVFGESASASQRLLVDILRGQWGFKGYMVSDCDSIEDIFLHHKIVATAAEASALAVKRGMDLDCGKTYKALVEAVQKGLITEAELDVSVRRLMKTRFELGMFESPSQVKWAQVPYSVNQSAEHDLIARRAAQKSIVLLKNNGVLPLSKQTKKIAVIGPTADDLMSLLGNYYGTPAKPVTILEGIKAAVSPESQVSYARGTDLVEGRSDPRAAQPIEPRFLKPNLDSAEQGLKGEYFATQDLTGEASLTRIDSRIAFRWDRGSPTDDLVARGEVTASRALSSDGFSVRWTGFLTAPVSGKYELNVGANDGYRLYLNGELKIDHWQLVDRLQADSANVDLEAGKSYAIKLEYFEGIRDAEVRLAWRLPGAKSAVEEAIDIAKASDVIIYVGGLTGDIEGEEMKVSYPGFAGGDRTNLLLPATQAQLLEALYKTGKPIVLVVTSGSALALDWAQDKLPAILQTWYPGQRGGNAVADVLFGDFNPAGRLPITFYKADTQLPEFEDYSMRNRTYRYYQGKALYPFGHGLSYTQFNYSNLVLEQVSSKGGATLVSNKGVLAQNKLKVTLKVKNTGKLAGEEVVQLYIRPIKPKHERSFKELRSFARVQLGAGEEKEVSFELTPDVDFSIYSPELKHSIVDSGNYAVQIGASSEDIRISKQIFVK